LTENKNKKEDKKNTAHCTVIEMETNEEECDLEQILMNKDKGYTRSNPQGEPQKKPEIYVYDCSGCEKKFNKREHMIIQQKTYEVRCHLCDKRFKMQSKLQEHERIEHEEMICHLECGSGICVMNEIRNEVKNSYKCNFCDRTFMSKNSLSTHRMDVHRTFKPCREIASCQYQNGCYFSHTPVPLGKVRCYQCGEEFNSKNIMMVHRKIHGEVAE
jgi:DNA-directed RNA polymerase subunit RPC12/RpoP